MKLALLTDGGRSSVGRAPDCDSGCRGFESRRSPHFSKTLIIIPSISYSGIRNHEHCRNILRVFL